MTPDRHDPQEPHPRFPQARAPWPPAPSSASGASGTANPAGGRGPDDAEAAGAGPPRDVPPAPPRRGPRGTAPTPRAMLAAVLAGAAALAAYVWGAAPTVLPGDAAELATVAFKGGVAHTPGYPTFVLLGQVASLLLSGDPAHRITLLSAFMGAVSVGLFALVLSEFGLAWSALLAGSLGLAGTFTLWWAAIRAEVYTTGLALALFALWRVLVARRTLRAAHGLLAAFAIGLAMTVHLSFGLVLAIAGVMLIVRAARAHALGPALLAGALVMLALGLSPYLYLPWADAHFTLTNHLRTAIEAAGGQYGLTPDRFDSVPERMRFLLAGPEAHPRDLVHHLPTGLVNLCVAAVRFALFDAGPIALLLGLLGAHNLLRRDRGATLLFVAGGILTPAFGALAVDGALLNVFMMTTSLAAALFAAGAYDRIAAGGGLRPLSALLLVFVVIAVPHELRVRADLHPMFRSAWLVMPTEGPPPVWTRVPQFRDETRARREALAILASVPESSFVAARWDRVTVLKYLQSAEGMRPDLWLDVWYEPSHIVRIARWQREHALETHPVVVVDEIAGLTQRLAKPQIRHLPGGVTLHLERAFVDTTLALPH